MKVRDYLDEILQKWPELTAKDLQPFMDLELSEANFINEVARLTGKANHELEDELHKWMAAAAQYKSHEVDRIIQQADEVFDHSDDDQKSTVERIVDSIDDILKK